MDWVVLRNRLATTEARNRKRLEDRLNALAKRVGFRIERHSLRMYGTCKDCQREGDPQ